MDLKIVKAWFEKVVEDRHEVDGCKQEYKADGGIPAVVPEIEGGSQCEADENSYIYIVRIIYVKQRTIYSHIRK